MLGGKLRDRETYKENENKFVPSRLYPPPHTNTDQQFTSKCKVFTVQQFGVVKKKVRSKTFDTVPLLVLFKTQKRLKQQHSPSELKPAGVGAALDTAPFMKCE